MKKLLVASLIVPIMFLGAVRPAKAGNKVGAILTGVAVGIGAALILDALAPPPVVYQPAPVIVHTPPPVIITAPPVVYHTPPPFVYRPAPVFVHAPRHVSHRPHRSHHHGDHGRRHWRETPRNDH